MTNSLKLKIKNNGWSFVAQFGYWGLSFLSFILLLRLLNKEDLGQWILYMSLITLIESLRTGFVQNGYIFYSKQESSNDSKLRSAGLSILLGISLIGFSILYLFSNPLSILFEAPKLSGLIIASGLYLLSSSLVRINEINWISNHDFKSLAFSRVGYSILFFISILLINFWKGDELSHLVYLQFISSVVCYLFVHIKKNSAFGYSFLNEIKVLLQYGKYSAGTNLTSIVTNKSDTLFIGAILGPSAVSLYNVASRLINVLEIPLTSISLYFYPIISKAYQEKDILRVKKELSQGALASLFFFIPIITSIVFLGDWLVVFIAGTDYIESAFILKLLATFILVKTIGRFCGITLDAIGKPKFNFYILIISLIVNVSLNFLLIHIMGITGVAVATISTWVFGALISSRKLSENRINIFRSMIKQLQLINQEFKNHKNKKAWN